MNHMDIQSVFDHLPLRDSFGSRTDYDIYDPNESPIAVNPNGLSHDRYLAELLAALKVMERNHQGLQRLVRQHRGQWSFCGLRRWLTPAM